MRSLSLKRPMLRVRALRKARAWTQMQLAAKCGLHPQTISSIETGRIRPSEGELAKLAKALGVADAATLADVVESATTGGV